MNFEKFFRKVCFIDDLRWLLLISGSGIDRSKMIHFLFVTNKLKSPEIQHLMILALKTVNSFPLELNVPKKNTFYVFTFKHVHIPKITG